VSSPSAALDPEGRAALETVLALLAEERASVSSITEGDRAWRVHVDDSLTGLEVPDLRGAVRIADIGSGAGFPGLPLAVALPDSIVDLVESVGRKCEFVRRAAGAAGITNANIINARSEDLAASEGRERYGAVTARAVGRLSTLAELAAPLLLDQGVLVAWKGKRNQSEEEEMVRAAESLAMRPEAVLPVGPYAGSRHRHLHVLRKTGPTPADLPRRAGIAKKRPRGS
jgi:16S rRNA (guanine527-N7)-methyltransferase